MSVSITIDLYSVHVHLSRVDSPAGGSPRVAHKLTTDSKRVVSLTLNCPFSRVLLQLTLYNVLAIELQHNTMQALNIISTRNANVIRMISCAYARYGAGARRVDPVDRRREV